jgi:hypothetical protein
MRKITNSILSVVTASLAMGAANANAQYATQQYQPQNAPQYQPYVQQSQQQQQAAYVMNDRPQVQMHNGRFFT